MCIALAILFIIMWFHLPLSALRMLSSIQPSKLFPYGISNWVDLRSDNYHFADKTLAIPHLEARGKALKSWRPRRWERPTSKRNSYMIMSFSFKNVSPDGDVYNNFRDYVNSVVLDFIETYDITGILIHPTNHLFNLQRVLDTVRRLKRRIYLIVDEYDSFANRLLLNVDTSTVDAGRMEYQKSISNTESYLRSWGNVIKDHEAIDRMFFTGVTPMAFSDGLSSLNTVKDISNDPLFETTFGFTENELRDAIKHCECESKDIESHIATMKTNYNGYRFNSAQKEAVFNPQMCLYYLDEIKQKKSPPSLLLDPNIADASDNVAQYLISNYRGADSYIKYPFGIISGTLPLTVQPVFRSAAIFDKSSEKAQSALVSLAYYHGFLTHTNPLQDSGKLTSPNLVIRRTFFDALVRDFPTRYADRLWNAVSSDNEDEDTKKKKGIAALNDMIKEKMKEKAVDLGLDAALEAVKGLLFF